MSTIATNARWFQRRATITLHFKILHLYNFSISKMNCQKIKSCSKRIFSNKYVKILMIECNIKQIHTHEILQLDKGGAGEINHRWPWRKVFTSSYRRWQWVRGWHNTTCRRCGCVACMICASSITVYLQHENIIISTWFKAVLGPYELFTERNTRDHLA